MTIEEKVAKFCEIVQVAVDAYAKEWYPNLPYRTELIYTKGRKYFKVLRQDTQTSVYCFIDQEGFIWYPAGYNAPTKNFHRGNVDTIIAKGIHPNNVNSFQTVQK